jgi:polyisoprenoid-binding protein YceI
MSVSGRHTRVVALVATVTMVQVVPSLLRAEQTGGVRFELAPAGNEARYRVREQLAGVDLPNDAVGLTSAISGAIVLDPTGKVIPGQSTITVDITGLTSDQQRRDRFIQRNVLQTDQFPKVELAVKELRGLKYPVPASGEVKFEIVGDLTVHGVTKASTWQVTATPKDGGLSGIATTSFLFTDYGMTKPRVMMVLSVDDTIKLEYRFAFVPRK